MNAVRTSRHSLSYLVVRLLLASSDQLRSFIWNPHWQCFADEPYCARNASIAFRNMLSTWNLDFATVVMANGLIDIPAGWLNIRKSCGVDHIDLFYDQSTWEPLGSAATGCFETTRRLDRPWILQRFRHVVTNLSLNVIGAHYPHSYKYHSLSAAIRYTACNTGISATLLMADTNDPEAPDAQGIMDRLGVAHEGSCVGTHRYFTCCNDQKGFNYQFDRIVANFGESMNAELVFDPLPPWAGRQFHKGRLTVET